VDFYEQLNQEINQLRQIYHKLAEAREIAEGLQEGTIEIIDAAKDHVCREFVAATEIWDGMLE
jgi:hypothetical protein